MGNAVTRNGKSLEELETVLVQAFVASLREKARSQDADEATYRVTLTVEEVHAKPSLAGLGETPPSPEEETAQHELCELVHKILASRMFTDREREALRLRFGFGCREHTLTAAAKKMGICPQRVDQLVQNALRKLRRHGKCKCLKDFHK